MMKQSKVKIWLDSARPKTLWAAVSPVMIGAAMAQAAGGVHWGVLAMIVTSATLIQIGTNFANDYYDFIKGADTDERTGPARATAAGLVTPSAMRRAFVVTFGLAVFIGFFLVLRGGWPILAIGVASVVCGVLYTAGPFPLAYVGLGEVFVLVFFGPVAVGGTYYLMSSRIEPAVLVAGLAPGLLACAILVVNNFRDYETDKVAGKRTLVVRFGRSFGVAEYVGCIVGACVVPVWLCVSFGGHWWALMSVLVLPLSVGGMRKMLAGADGEVLNGLLARTAKLMVIYSLLFSVGWVL